MLTAEMMRTDVGQSTGEQAGEITEESDEALVARAGKGDRTAFRTLVDRHGPWVHGLAAKTMGSRAAAEDITQETFLRVWRSAEGWQPKAKFTTWLYRVAVNLCLDQKRKRSFVALDGDQNAAADEEAIDGEQHLHRRHVAQVVRLRIARLPERQRVALILFHYQGHTMAEVAEIMESTEGAVESLLFRARSTLKEKLEGLEGELGQ